MIPNAMRWASALSLEKDSQSALEESAAQIEKMLGARPDALFVFVSPHHGASYQTVGEKLLKRLNPRHMSGCSGGGIIGAGREAEQSPAISLTAAVLPNVEITPFRLRDEALPDLDSGPRIWEERAGVKASTEPHFVIMADPFSIRADEMLAGLDFAFPKSVKIGGLASGMNGPGQSALYLDNQFFRDGAVGLSFSGAISVDSLVAQGCRPIGKPMSVTKCQQRILAELDKQRALDVLREIHENSNERDRQLIRTSLFLGISMDPFKEGAPKPGDFLIRNLIGMDADRGALMIAAVLREGQTVQFHVRDAEAANEDLAAVLRRYSLEHLNAAKGESLPPPPKGALLFSCNGRGVNLYGRPDNDTQAFHSELGDVPLGGFFCNGEIGPVGSTTYIHGFTSCFGIFRPKSL